MPVPKLPRTLIVALLLVAAAWPASGQTRPLYGWVQFSFPSYTSLHDCKWLNGTSDEIRATCRDVLYNQFEMSRDTDLKPVVEQQAGVFGDHPLLFLRIGLLHCRDRVCKAAGGIRTALPEQIRHDADVENFGSHLLYRIPSELHGDRHILILSGLDRDWQSPPFSTPFRHNYFSVRFDPDHPGRLILDRDWASTIADRENATRLLTDTRDMLAIWAALVFVAGIIAGIMGMVRRQGWGLAGRAWVMHAVTLLLLLALTFLPPWNNAVILALLPLLYLASLPLDACFIRRGLLRRDHVTTWRDALLPAAILRLGTLAAIATGLWALSRL